LLSLREYGGFGEICGSSERRRMSERNSEPRPQTLA
jgi:hypothetical protein